MPSPQKKKKKVTVDGYSCFKSKCEDKHDEFTGGYVMAPPCFLLSFSAVKITNWSFHELSYPSLALKAFEHSSQLVVNSAFLSGVRRVLLGCSTAHSLGSVIAKGKLCLNYDIVTVLQCLRPIDFSIEASFLIPRSCIAKRVEQSHIAWERVGGESKLY